MSLGVYVRRLYNNLVGSDNIAYGTLPTSADGVAAAAVTLTAKAAAWTWSAAYIQIVATVGAAEVQLVGASLENFVGAAGQGEVRIGTGLAAAEVEIARFQTTNPQIILPKPIRIAAATRVAGAYRTSTGAADTVDVKLSVLTGF